MKNIVKVKAPVPVPPPIRYAGAGEIEVAKSVVNYRLPTKYRRVKRIRGRGRVAAAIKVGRIALVSAIAVIGLRGAWAISDALFGSQQPCQPCVIKSTQI